MRIIIFFIISASLLIGCAGNQGYNPQNDASYYVRYDMKSQGGIITELDFIMILSEDEFRAEEFTVFYEIGLSEENSKAPPESSALHHAITKILVDHGIKTVKNKKNLINFIYSDETILSYAGVIKAPFKIQKKGYLPDSERYKIEVEICFSPIAFPERWKWLYFKKRIHDTWEHIIAIF
ncbi:MAG: hypothetical protein HQK76_15070 [Desulfobacterales bacterium]|nr:hypothetical protein [Desulfobacterales bacterium]